MQKLTSFMPRSIDVESYFTLIFQIKEYFYCVLFIFKCIYFCIKCLEFLNLTNLRLSCFPYESVIIVLNLHPFLPEL